MTTLADLDIQAFSESDDETLLKRLLEIRRQRRTMPARKQAKAAAKKAPKQSKDLLQLMAGDTSPEQLEALIAALEAKQAKP